MPLLLALAFVLISSSGAFAQGPVAAYGLNAGTGTTVADDSGNGRAGTVTAATWTTGKFGGALSFNGSTAFVTIPDNAGLDLAKGTIEAWVSLAKLGVWHGLIAKGDQNNDNVHNYALEVDNLNRPTCILGSGTASMLVRGAALTANRLTHLACTWSGTLLTLYVDGVQAATAAQSIAPAANAAPLYLGQFGGNADRLTGVLDEVRIYNRALSAAEILADMAAPVVAGPPPPLPGKGVLTVKRVDVLSWTVSWTDAAPNNGAQFQLERATAVGGPFASLIVLPEGTTSYEDKAVVAGQKYCYRARELQGTVASPTYSNVACTP